MKRFIFFLSILAISLTACESNSLSEASFQTAIAGTQAAQITPLSEINLDQIPFQSGDLPNQYTSGQISYKWPDDLLESTKPDNVVIQKVGWDISSGFSDDYVMIALFKSTQNLYNSFNEVIKTYKAEEITPATVGEKNAFSMVSTFSGDGFLVFTRCSALVVIRITGADVNEDLLTSYALRIDKRVKPLVCHP